MKISIQPSSAFLGWYVYMVKFKSSNQMERKGIFSYLERGTLIGAGRAGLSASDIAGLQVFSHTTNSNKGNYPVSACSVGDARVRGEHPGCRADSNSDNSQGGEGDVPQHQVFLPSAKNRKPRLRKKSIINQASLL